MSSLYRELGYGAMRLLATVLDHESPRGVDWKGLADKMGFSYEVIIALRGSRSPTVALLERWEHTAGSEANLNGLISLLQGLGCAEGVDILEQEKERRVDHIDIPARPRVEGGLEVSPHYPVTPCSSLDPSALDPDEIQRIRQVAMEINPQQLAQQLESITVSDNPESSHPVESSSSSPVPGSLESLRSHKYDVFLSFAEQDEEFAEELRLRLVENTGAKVFVPSNGLVSDRAFHEEIADMIKDGCIRTIVILSPDYLSSPWCGFEANVAFVNAPAATKNKTIPILYRHCEVPAFLSHLHYLDYPRFSGNRKDCENYFWGRLYKSLTFKV